MKNIINTILMIMMLTLLWMMFSTDNEKYYNKVERRRISIQQVFLNEGQEEYSCIFKENNREKEIRLPKDITWITKTKLQNKHEVVEYKKEYTHWLLRLVAINSPDEVVEYEIIMPIKEANNENKTR